MNLEELLYNYIYNEFLSQKQRKQDIRNRSSFFFALGFPIIVTLCISSIQSGEEISCLKGVFLIFSGVTLVITMISFLLIYLPSNQLTYYPNQLIEEVDRIADLEEYNNFIESAENEKEREKNKEYYATRFFSNTYSDLFNLYEKTNHKFKMFFAIISVSLCLSLFFVALSYIF